MIQYHWEFPTLEAVPSMDGETNVVSVIHWRLVGTLNEYTGSTYGSVGVEYEAGQPFTPFNQLTEPQVEGWVVDKLGVDQIASMKEGIQRQIEEQQSPSIIPLSPPWSSEAVL